MPTTSAQATSPLVDYLELFEALASLGLEVVVIGGCAVGAYARLLGEAVHSNDLDLFVTRQCLDLILNESEALSLRLERMAAAREVPVTVLHWKTREINLLTATEGLAAPDVEARTAREFLVSESASTAVLVVDPFDLLRNKLAINRPKDAPHIALLRRFLEAEVVHGFQYEEEPRARIGAAERLLEVLDRRALDEALSARLVPLARLGADFRFLAHRLPTAALVSELAARAPDEETRAAVARIAITRGWPV